MPWVVRHLAVFLIGAASVGCSSDDPFSSDAPPPAEALVEAEAVAERWLRCEGPGTELVRADAPTPGSSLADQTPADVIQEVLERANDDPAFAAFRGIDFDTPWLLSQDATVMGGTRHDRPAGFVSVLRTADGWTVPSLVVCRRPGDA